MFDDGSAQFTFFQDLVLKRTDSNSTNVAESICVSHVVAMLDS